MIHNSNESRWPFDCCAQTDWCAIQFDWLSLVVFGVGWCRCFHSTFQYLNDERFIISQRKRERKKKRRRKRKSETVFQLIYGTYLESIQVWLANPCQREMNKKNQINRLSGFEIVALDLPTSIPRTSMTQINQSIHLFSAAHKLSNRRGHRSTWALSRASHSALAFVSYYLASRRICKWHARYPSTGHIWAHLGTSGSCLGSILGYLQVGFRSPLGPSCPDGPGPIRALAWFLFIYPFTRLYLVLFCVRRRQ